MQCTFNYPHTMAQHIWDTAPLGLKYRSSFGFLSMIQGWLDWCLEYIIDTYSESPIIPITEFLGVVRLVLLEASKVEAQYG